MAVKHCFRDKRGKLNQLYFPRFISIQTFQALPPKLSFLHEPRKHLRLHEDLQESPQALGGHGLTEGLALEGRGSRRGGRRGGGFFITIAATHKE